MNDPNITMEEYIWLEEEKARKRGKMYNQETAMYDKIWYDEDVRDHRSVETEFPAIVFNDALTSEVTPSCEPTISPLNDNKIDFRMLCDESDDEDYTSLKTLVAFILSLSYEASRFSNLDPLDWRWSPKGKERDRGGRR
ncbi:hypothetical protein Tco_0441700 [Tanacetum coccineum]